jgi:hypothetical protein
MEKTQVKKPLNAFLMYRREMSAVIKKQNPMATIGEISSITGKRWAMENAETKRRYQEMAKKAFQEHKAMYPEYIWPSRSSAAKKRRQQEMQNELSGSSSDLSERSSESASFGKTEKKAIKLPLPIKTGGLVSPPNSLVSSAVPSAAIFYCEIHGPTVSRERCDYPQVVPVCKLCVSSDIRNIGASPHRQDVNRSNDESFISRPLIQRTHDFIPMTYSPEMSDLPQFQKYELERLFYLH